MADRQRSCQRQIVLLEKYITIPIDDYKETSRCTAFHNVHSVMVCREVAFSSVAYKDQYISICPALTGAFPLQLALDESYSCNQFPNVLYFSCLL